MTQGAPIWWQHQRDRLAALRKRLLSSMCVCGLKASMMKGLCGDLLPLPVLLCSNSLACLSLANSGETAGATSMGLLCTMTRLQSHMVTSLPSSKVITPTVSCQDMLRSLLLLVVGRDDTVERFPSVAQSNVLKPQVGVVQMLNFQSIRTNHDGASLPKKRGGGLLVPWPGRTSVVRYFGPLCKVITRR